MLRRRIAIAAIGAFALVALAPAPALCEPQATKPAPSEEDLAGARRLFFDAVSAQDAGRYQEALSLYERVGEVIVSPTLLFNVATCREKLGQLLEAKATFERALAEAIERGDEEVQGESRSRLATLREEIPHIVVRLPPGADDAVATLDDAPIATAALADLRVAPGSHRLVIRSERHLRVFAVGLELPLRATRTVEVDLGPEKGPATTTVDRPAATTTVKKANWLPAAIAGGSAVVFGGGSVATWLIGHDQSKRYEALNAAPTAANRGERRDLQSSVATMSVLNASCIVATVIAVGVGVYFLIRPPTSSTQRASASALSY